MEKEDIQREAIVNHYLNESVARAKKDQGKDHFWNNFMSFWIIGIVLLAIFLFLSSS